MWCYTSRFDKMERVLVSAYTPRFRSSPIVTNKLECKLISRGLIPAHVQPIDAIAYRLRTPQPDVPLDHMYV